MTKQKFNIGVAGRFRIVAVKVDGSGERELAPWFNNLIVDAGLNRLGTGGVGHLVRVGSGASAPAVANTSLEALVASTDNVTANDYNVHNTVPYYGYHRRTWRFPAGAAAGNLSEVGVGWDASGNPIFSRARILDPEGQPTTITVLGDEFLDVTYEIRLYPPPNDIDFNLTINSVVYACKLRASLVNSGQWIPQYLLSTGTLNQMFQISAFDGDIGTITQSPSGQGSNTLQVAQGAYANNSLKRLLGVTAPLDAWNFGTGIKSLSVAPNFSTLGCYQMSFSPAVPKNNAQVLNLGFEVSWARFAI